MRDIRRVIGSVGYLGGLMAVPEEFCWAWSQMTQFNSEFVCEPGEQIQYLRSRMSLHATARNTLVKDMHGEWLLQLDADVVMGPEILLQFLTLQKRYHVPVITGVYRHKSRPYHPMLWQWVDQGDEAGLVPLVEIDMHAPLVQVDACGGGALFVHREVFVELAKKFPDEEPFEHRGRFGEDFSFCLRCKDAGIPIFAAPAIEVTHLRVHGVTSQDYVADWYSDQQDIVLPAVGAAS